ncbi:hypothetical protein A0O32_0031 [Anoxybacillus flavithermus]|uniref:Uncharacterized protein n=1 Tax=Anoxybacillus flavithermus TaxID=33934 RepID=A0A178TTY5_9BACL|nr:hypothetical protein TAF16_2248 [Anoxybacillus flavithermus]OAO84945.1 hypothetical protein A0O32_0031 [Anoxybacillus flavithermus]
MPHLHREDVHKLETGHPPVRERVQNKGHQRRHDWDLGNKNE